MKKTLTFVPILLAFLLIMPVAAVEGYNDILSPDPSGNTAISWKVVDAPEVPFSLYWSGTGNWLASPNSLMNFTISEIGEDVQGQVSLGNMTWNANDTNLALDLILGIWGITPFSPGLIIKNTTSGIDVLISTAEQSAERVSGNWMNGTLETGYRNITLDGEVYQCVYFDYEQDPPSFGEPQRTYLAYDTRTGILIQANTSYSFGTPYSFVLELDSVIIPSNSSTNPVTNVPSELIIGIVLFAVIIVAFFAIMRSKRG